MRRRMCLSWDSDSKSTLRVSPFRTWWCLLFFILGYECHAFLISRSGPSFPTLGKYLGTSFFQLTLVVSVPFRVLCWLEFKKFQGFFTWWSIWNNRRSKRVNGMLRLDLLLKRFSSSVQIRCGFIDLWGNNRNYAEDFHSIILPKHPFVRFHCTYQYLSNIDTFRWIWMAGRFDGQI